MKYNSLYRDKGKQKKSNNLPRGQYPFGQNLGTVPQVLLVLFPIKL